MNRIKTIAATGLLAVATLTLAACGPADAEPKLTKDSSVSEVSSGEGGSKIGGKAGPGKYWGAL